MSRTTDTGLTAREFPDSLSVVQRELLAKLQASGKSSLKVLVASSNGSMILEVSGNKITGSRPTCFVLDDADVPEEPSFGGVPLKTMQFELPDLGPLPVFEKKVAPYGKKARFKKGPSNS